MSVSPSSGVDRADFREHRTREQLNDLLRHGHVIPVSRGWTFDHVQANFPGWTWNQLIDIIRAAGILVSRGGSPPACHDQVAAFHFSSDTEFLVEWIDEQGATTPPDDSDGAGSRV